MAASTLKQFAEQIGISSSKLKQQLLAAGIAKKDLDGSLSDQEKEQLLSYLRGGSDLVISKDRPKITLSRKSTSSVLQASRTGGSRTVHVEVRKRRTYVRRGELQRQQEEAKKTAEAEEIKKKTAEAEEIKKKIAEAEEIQAKAKAVAEAEAEAVRVALEDEQKKAIKINCNLDIIKIQLNTLHY